MQSVMTAATNPGVTDRIEKSFEVKATRSRVWRAISDAREFATWFGVELDRSFAPGTSVIGRLPYKGEIHTFEMQVERVEPESYFSYRWHPYAMDPKVDYSKEPTTLVEFRLEEVPGGTLLRVVESGFQSLPAARQRPAHEANSGDCEEQLRNIERHVAEHPSPRA